MDYKLYPFQFEHVDWTIYYTVKTFMSATLLSRHRGPLHDDVRESTHLVVSDRLMSRLSMGGIHSTGQLGTFYLVFPREDLSVSYEYKALCQEAVILCHSSRYIPSTPYDVDGEGEYEANFEYFYYVNSENKLILQHEDCNWDWSWPQIYNNERSLDETLKDVLCLMQGYHLREEEWYKRLNVALAMLNAGDVNELHILHNAGLYDADGLWALLRQKGVKEALMSDVRGDYQKELRRYAMYVLNRLDWIKGGYRIESTPESDVISAEILENFSKEASRRSVYPGEHSRECYSPEQATGTGT